MKRFLPAAALAALILSRAAAADPPAAESPPNEIPEAIALDPQAALLARLSGLFGAEDPTSLYDFNIGDEQVDFILEGSWKSEVTSGINLSFDGGTSAASFQSPVFVQTVDLTAWVLINGTWYFEASFAEEFRRNTVAAGFIGGEDDSVKHVRLGNAGISFPDDYPFIRVGGGDVVSPGAMATFAGDRWTADAVVRYDTAAWEEKILYGMNEVSDILVPVTAWTRGKWFVLPDAGVAGAVRVFASDDDGALSSGDGRRWRELKPAEYRVQSVSGVLMLRTAQTADLAVSYTGSWTVAGAPGPSLVAHVSEARSYFEGLLAGSASVLGIPDPADIPAIADRYLVVIAGETRLLIKHQGTFSPFEIASRYAIGSIAGEAAVVHEQTGSIDKTYAALAVVKDADDEGTLADWNDSRVELSRVGSDSTPRSCASRYPLAPDFPLLYAPANGGKKPDTDLAVRQRGYFAVSTISLGTDVIPGTITVERNGISDSDFSFDEKMGIVSLTRPPGTTETVRIRWMRADSSARNGTLTIAAGARYRPRDAVELFGASSLRWNLSSDGYTDASEGSPGTFLATLGASYEGARVSASTAFAGEVSVSDTTGFYRACGMGTSAITLNPDDDWYRLTAADREPLLGEPALPVPVQLDAADRVPVENSDDGEPYTVGDSSVSARVLVIDCELAAAGDWAAAEIVDESDSIDLRSAASVSIALKNAGPSDSYQLYLQLGVGESELYEDPSLVRTWSVSVPPPDGHWYVRTIRLSDADRSALGSPRGMRLIVVGSGPASVDLRSGPIEVASAGFTGTADYIEEIADASVPSLASVQGSIVRRFNASRTNSVLAVGFNPSVSNPDLSASQYLPPLPIENYDELVFYLNGDSLPSPASGHIDIRLDRAEDGETRNVLSAWVAVDALTEGSWHEIRIDLKGGTVSRDGIALGAASAGVTHIDRSKRPSRVTFEFVGWPVPPTVPDFPDTAYRVLVDEIHLAGTKTDYVGRNKTEVAWRWDGPEAKLFGRRVLGDLSLRSEAETATRVSSPEPAFAGQAEAGATILGARIEAGAVAGNSSDRFVTSSTHSALVPVGPLTLRERYSVSFESEEVRRENAIALSWPLSLSATSILASSPSALDRRLLFSLDAPTLATRVGSWSADASAALIQTGPDEFGDLDGSAWGQIWRESATSQASGGEPDARLRSVTARLRAEWSAPPSDGGFSVSGVRLETEGKSSYSRATETSIAGAGTFRLAVPLRIGSSTLTIDWARIARREEPRDPGGAYPDDLEYLRASLAVSDWAWRTPPIADLFLDSVPSSMRGDDGSDRSFSNAYGLGWQRPSLGAIRDLALPTSLAARVWRETVVESSVSGERDIRGASVTGSFSALNVAGRLGVLHLFDWYEQDEVSQLYVWEAEWGKGYYAWSLDACHAFAFLDGESDALEAESVLHYESDTIEGTGKNWVEKVRLTWKHRGDGSFVSSLVSRFTDLALGTRREDSATFSIGSGEKTSASLDVLHELITEIGAHAEASVFAGATALAQDGSLSYIQIRFGISGTIEY